MATNPWPGRLVVVEGVSRSGKTTAVLAALAAAGDDARTVVVEWNSFPPTHELTTRLKHERLLDPLSFCLAHLLDFSLTYRHVVIPALRSGRTVLANRYLYTAWVRDTLRGVDDAVLRALAPRFVRPSQTFYLTASLESIRARYRAEPQKYGVYGCGQDLPDASEDAEASFLDYQRRQADLYEHLARAEGFIRIDDGRELAAHLRPRA